jgi:hypothetical protein
MSNIQSNNALTKTAKWAKITALMAFIVLGFEFFQLVFGGISQSKSVLIIGAKFMFSSIFSLVTSINLYNFAKYASISLCDNDEKFLYQAFRHLRIFFTVIGVYLIIIGTLFILGLLIFIAAKFLH